MGRYLIAVLLAFGLAACEPRGEIIMDPTSAAVGSVERLYIGTSRDTDPKTGAPYSSARSTGMHYVRLDVSVPPDRMAGEIVWPRPRQKPDPGRQFLATELKAYPNPAAFRADLRQAILNQPGRKREAVVFVHGFNNNFAEGAYRLAQLGSDLAIRAPLVHYSWPSAAHPLGYAYDRDSALIARDGLESLLQEVEAAGASSIVVVAHSMGASLVMETLRQIAIARDGQLMSRISGVVLISPDIDVDVFRAQAVRIGSLPEPFVIFTSKKDHVLALSARLTGERERLGNIKDISRLGDLRVTILDTTAFSTGGGHFNLGNSPALISLLGRLPDIDSAFAGDPTGRAGLLPGVVLTAQRATEIIMSPVTALSQ